MEGIKNATQQSTRFKVNPVKLETEIIEDVRQDYAASTSAQVYHTVGPDKSNKKSVNNSNRHSLEAEPKFKKASSVKERRIKSLIINEQQEQPGSRNGNMVLQLILSADAINTIDSNNYFTSSSSNNESIISSNNNNLKFRENRQESSNESQQNLNSRVSSSTSPYYLNRLFNSEHVPGQSTPQPSFHLYTSDTIQEEINNEISPTPTCDEKKRQMFKKHLTIILSCIYAVFIVTLGLVIYISDIIIGNTALAETFSIYLLIIGFVYMVYLVIDIRIYVNKKRNEIRLFGHQNEDDNIDSRMSIDGNFHLSMPQPSWSALVQQETHQYCFSKGRHSGSFYLKVGAAGFCLGHLIHSGLLLGYQIVFLTSDGDAFYDCASVATLVLDIIYPIYSFFLLYFIFKYSNVIINKRLEIGRFALMHCIASSLCFWIWTILRETTDSLSHKENSIQNIEELIDDSSEESYEKMNEPLALKLTDYGQHGAKKLVEFFNGSITPRIGTVCANDVRMKVIYQNFSPYLYPFTVEYSILVVGVFFIIWQNIGKCEQKKHCTLPRFCKGNGFASNLVINVDCHSANTGLFCGIIVIVCSIVSIILFFIALSTRKYLKVGLLVGTITEITFGLLMTISAILAYRKITKLDINYHPVSLLDDLLLFICIPAFFLNAIFSFIPAIYEQNYLFITNYLIELTQILVQTPLIIDGLRRCSNSIDLRLKAPGRGLITFLVTCNIAMWLTETFEIKSHELLDPRAAFYGKVWWTIIGHMTLPLQMFYRFHSSVCLVDIWKSAYESAK